MKMKSVYVSSTFEDLKPYRESVYRGLSKMRYDVRAMEDYVARDGRMVDAVVDDVASCDIYVGIFAWRYGYVPPQDNPDGLSITELEYREAGKSHKSRLIFLLEAGAAWSPKFMDSVTGDNEKGARILRLRTELAQQMHSLFSTPEDLVLNAQAAVHLAEVNARFQALAGDVANASCLTMMSSATPEIVTNIRRAITEGVKADLIKVNLGTGKEWWSTRLHLLCALCAEYTDVRQILFEDERYRVLGMCSPSQARRALAKAFPTIESAYRESMLLPEQSSADSVADVMRIVDRYSTAMDRLGGEPNVKQWLDPTVIESWPGVNKSKVDLPGGVVTRPIVEAVVRHQDPFVVLVKDGIVQQVVDRSALATRLALGEV
jgi:hypothetical protein